MKIGAHVSIKGSLELAVDRAITIGCDTFQIFTRNPRGWKAKELDLNVADNFIKKRKNAKIELVFSHMPYLANLASPDPIIFDKSINALKEEFSRCEILSIPYIVTHVGSSKETSKQEGIERIVLAINKTMKKENSNVKLLLENTTSKKESLGSNIEDICEIIAKTDFPDKLGICFDTCHAFASGYDIRQLDVIDELISKIESQLGKNVIKLIHSNDSKFDLGEGRDRHEHIGLGKIGKKGFENLIKCRKLCNIPFICETPDDDTRDGKDNIQYLRNLVKSTL
ncbi:MAG: deoxyribonuclease IV [Candidatus Heimdallarchaeota archaeon]